jgi:hypothetical protein
MAEREPEPEPEDETLYEYLKRQVARWDEDREEDHTWFREMLARSDRRFLEVARGLDHMSNELRRSSARADKALAELREEGRAGREALFRILDRLDRLEGGEAGA